ncbi:AAA family ATPase, partial [Candidatus Poribacteria bacterium]|nr:AAA family ATPase [Candidatus Poribacteria bacterium]
MILDKNQIKAINHFTGPAIVVAGPGSGKTTVVTERILNLIQSHNIPPKNILAIAF